MTAKQFWNWFETNKRKYINCIYVRRVTPLSEENEPLRTLSKQLNSYCQGISFSINAFSEEGRELIISGDLPQFESVSQLIRAAPRIRNWKFTHAPNMDFITEGIGFDFNFQYRGFEFNPTSMWFLPVTCKTRKNGLGILVGFKDLERYKEEELLFFTRLMTVLCLGRKVAGMNISVEVTKLPDNPAQDGYIRLAELGRYIDRRQNTTRRTTGL